MRFNWEREHLHAWVVECFHWEHVEMLQEQMGKAHLWEPAEPFVSPRYCWCQKGTGTWGAASSRAAVLQHCLCVCSSDLFYTSLCSAAGYSLTLSSSDFLIFLHLVCCVLPACLFSLSDSSCSPVSWCLLWFFFAIDVNYYFEAQYKHWGFYIHFPAVEGKQADLMLPQHSPFLIGGTAAAGAAAGCRALL